MSVPTWRPGWPSSRRSSSPPAYPLAPATATVYVTMHDHTPRADAPGSPPRITTADVGDRPSLPSACPPRPGAGARAAAASGAQGRPHRLGRAQRTLAGTVHLLGGERPVCRPEPQGVRQRLAPLTHLGPCRRRRAGCSPACSPAPTTRAASTAAAGTSAPTTRARSSLATGCRDSGSVNGSRTAPATTRTSRSTSTAHARAGRPRAATTRGCSSPACPTSVPASPAGPSTARASRAQRPGCHGVCSASAATVTGTPATDATWRASSTASSQPTARPGPHHPAGSACPASTAARRRGWSGRAASRAASSASEGRPSDPGHAGVGGVRAGPHHRARPRTPQVGLATAQVADSRVQQRGEQVGPHLGLLVAQRVGQAQRPAARVVGRQRERVVRLRGHERVRQHLDQAPREARCSRTRRTVRWAAVRPPPGGGVGTRSGMAS